MYQLISKTLSEIVNEQFQTASVFEKYHLDYCCKGRRSLQQACSEENVPVNAIIEDLNKVYTHTTTVLDFNNMKLSHLAEYIVYTHHSYIRKNMPLIISYLQKVSSKHGNRHPELFRIGELFNELSMEITDHIYKEESVLFPRIEQLENRGSEQFYFNAPKCEPTQLQIIHMEAEHEVAGNKMNEIRLLTNNYTPPAEACTTYKLMYACLQAFEIDLHQHVHLENSILFPKALLLEKEIKMSSGN